MVNMWSSLSCSQVSVELNPGLTPPSVLPPGVGLVHVRGLGLNDTLHFLLCNHGAPALLMVHTNSTESEVHVKWPEFINHSSSGSLRVEPPSSVLYSSALVFTRVSPKSHIIHYALYLCNNYEFNNVILSLIIRV